MPEKNKPNERPQQPQTPQPETRETPLNEGYERKYVPPAGEGTPNPPKPRGND